MDAVWLEVTVETTGAELDSLSARLTGNGATGLVIEDEEDFKSFLEQNRQYWDYVDDQLLERMKGAARIKFYVTDDADGQGQLAKWMEGIDLPYTCLLYTSGKGANAMNEIIQSLYARKSVRAYTDRPVPAEVKRTVLAAAVQAPTAGGQQLYTILDITDQRLKDTLAETCLLYTSRCV